MNQGNSTPRSSCVGRKKPRKRKSHAVQQEDRASLKEWEQKADLANMILPVGWLPFGVKAAAEGRVMPSILGLLGMGLIGMASLYRAYGTTIEMYQGQSSNRKGRPAPAAAVAQPAAARKARTQLLESRLPGFSEPVSAVAALGLAFALTLARSEDDVVDSGNHDSHFRLDALEGARPIFRSRFGRWSRLAGCSLCSWAWFR